MNRIESVDFFRLLAIVAVVAIHSTPFQANLPNHENLYRILYIFINQVSRFAVPFFFFISGYFWALKVKRSKSPISSANTAAKRIGMVFIVWCIIYLLPLKISSIHEYGKFGPIKVAYWNIVNLINSPVTLIVEGTEVHLWFLPGLLSCLYIAALFLHYRWLKSLFTFSLFLYIIGLLAKAYSDTPIGIYINFNTRNGPFFGLLPFVSGIILSSYESGVKWFKYGLFLFFFGVALHFSEIFLLWKYFGTTLIQEYVIGTCFMGVGVGILSLSNHKIFQVPLFAIGRKTLGIYAIHYMFINLLRPIDKVMDNPFWEIGCVILVLVLSIVSVVLLSKNEKTKKFVE